MRTKLEQYIRERMKESDLCFLGGNLRKDLVVLIRDSIDVDVVHVYVPEKNAEWFWCSGFLQVEAVPQYIQDAMDLESDKPMIAVVKMELVNLFVGDPGDV